MTTGKFYVCGGSDAYWTSVNATTLLGAKRKAMEVYDLASNGKIEIGQAFGDKADFTERIERVAVRYGYDKWQQA